MSISTSGNLADEAQRIGVSFTSFIKDSRNQRFNCNQRVTSFCPSSYSDKTFSAWLNWDLFHVGFLRERYIAFPNKECKNKLIITNWLRFSCCLRTYLHKYNHVYIVEASLPVASPEIRGLGGRHRRSNHNLAGYILEHPSWRNWKFRRREAYDCRRQESPYDYGVWGSVVCSPSGSTRFFLISCQMEFILLSNLLIFIFYF